MSPTERVIVYDGGMRMDAGEDYLLVELQPGDPRDGSMRMRLTPEDWQRLVQPRERALAGLGALASRGSAVDSGQD